MTIQLSEHFTYSKLLRFTAPSIAMMIFTSIYSIIDGLFVSNFVGSTPFAAINIIYPFLMILGALGFMLGTGGSALVAKTLGQRHHFKAKKIFSLLVYTTIALGVCISAVSSSFLEDVLIVMGIEKALLADCLVYGYIILPAMTVYMLQYFFQSFWVAAARPGMGFFITLLAGLTNIVLDAVFIIGFNWGLAGAAWATVVSMIVGGIIPLIYFTLPNKTPLRLEKTGFYGRALLKAATNGSSEFLTQISISIVCILYNYQMLKFVGESGVVAYGVITYIAFIFISVFVGYAIGSNPIVSFHYGAENTTELRGLLQKNLIINGVFASFLTIAAELSAPILSSIFVGYDNRLMDMTVYGMRIYSISFLLAGFNIYASAFFTALNNGLVSAVISFCRTIVFECSCVLILPIYFGLNGIWSSIIVAETLALIVSVSCFVKFKNRYRY